MFGEIFICRFPFTSGAFSKPRPVLVLFELQQDVLICRITSATRSGPLDVAISDWRQAELAKPSVARLDRLVTAEKTILGRKLGKVKFARRADNSQGVEPAHAPVSWQLPTASGLRYDSWILASNSRFNDSTLQRGEAISVHSWLDPVFPRRVFGKRDRRVAAVDGHRIGTVWFEG